MIMWSAADGSKPFELLAPRGETVAHFWLGRLIVDSYMFQSAQLCDFADRAPGMSRPHERGERLVESTERVISTSSQKPNEEDTRQ